MEGSFIEKAEPLFRFDYGDYRICTYLNYSLIYDGDEVTQRDMQLFVKDGKLFALNAPDEVVAGNIIVDSYQDGAYMTVLNKDGTLVDLMDELSYPEGFRNQNIRSIGNNLYSDLAICQVEYEDGSIIAFNYMTGSVLYEEEGTGEEETMEFAEYIQSFFQDRLDVAYSEITNAYGNAKELRAYLSGQTWRDWLGGSDYSPVQEAQEGTGLGTAAEAGAVRGTGQETLSDGSDSQAELSLTAVGAGGDEAADGSGEGEEELVALEFAESGGEAAAAGETGASGGEAAGASEEAAGGEAQAAGEAASETASGGIGAAAPASAESGETAAGALTSGGAISGAADDGSEEESIASGLTGGSGYGAGSGEESGGSQGGSAAEGAAGAGPGAEAEGISAETEGDAASQTGEAATAAAAGEAAASGSERAEQGLVTAAATGGADFNEDLIIAYDAESGSYALYSDRDLLTQGEGDLVSVDSQVREYLSGSGSMGAQSAELLDLRVNRSQRSGLLIMTGISGAIALLLLILGIQRCTRKSVKKRNKQENA